MHRGIFCAKGMENFFQRDEKSFRTGSRKKDIFVRFIRFVHFVVEKGLVELELTVICREKRIFSARATDKSGIFRTFVAFFARAYVCAHR